MVVPRFPLFFVVYLFYYILEEFLSQVNLFCRFFEKKRRKKLCLKKQPTVVFGVIVEDKQRICLFQQKALTLGTSRTKTRTNPFKQSFWATFFKKSQRQTICRFTGAANKNTREGVSSLVFLLSLFT